MGNLIEYSGKLFETKANIVGQGVNIKGLMNAGIAKEFGNRFPDMKREYVDICHANNFLAGTTWVWEDPKSDYIVLNIASQDLPGKHATISFLREGISDAITQLLSAYNDVEVIALPRIGCGIGGLYWDDVKVVLDEAADAFDIDIEVWTPED
jgi:O-acetyl-ADP-ribose deacetylase (regulator of RNase III)